MQRPTALEMPWSHQLPGHRLYRELNRLWTEAAGLPVHGWSMASSGCTDGQSRWSRPCECMQILYVELQLLTIEPVTKMHNSLSRGS